MTERKTVTARKTRGRPSSSGFIEEVTTRNFAAKVRQAQRPAVIDFSATWCDPCKALAPILERVARHYGNDVAFFKVDADRNPGLMRRFHIYPRTRQEEEQDDRGIPTLVLFRRKEISRLVGCWPKRDVEAWLQKGLRRI
jgi:thioredoxin 1